MENQKTHEYELRRLVLSLKLIQDRIYIGFALVRDAAHQQAVQQEVDQLIAPELESYTVDLSTLPLGERVRIPAQKNIVTHLVGLYLLPRTDQRIITEGLNYAREYLAYTGGPVLVWLTPEQIPDFAMYGADVLAWRNGIFEFVPLGEHGMNNEPIADYRNPYDFVPFEGIPTYVSSAPNQACIGKDSYCGTLSCTLEVLTPLCIHQDPGKAIDQRRRLYAFTHMNNQPTIPATSLKGMLRSVHEVVTNSTMGMLKSRPKGWYRAQVPETYQRHEKGEKVNRLTPTEALFGMVSGQGDASVGYAGRVFLDDIPVPVALQEQRVSRPQGGMPKPEHKSFYFHPGTSGKVLGRKFYYHHKDVSRVVAVYIERGMPTIIVQAVPEGTKLAGTLRFVNLSYDELCSLVYTLVLEDHLAHKLGYGKPLGLGSVRIRITQLEVEPPVPSIHSGTSSGTDDAPLVPARFWEYGEPTRTDCTQHVLAMRDVAKHAWLQRPDGRKSYEAFTAIACWPQTENFIYPDYGFFRGEKNKPVKTTLWHYQGRTYFYPTQHPPATGSKQANSTVNEDEPTSEEPITNEEPEQPRRTGQFSRNQEIGYFVQDDETGKPYRSVEKLPKAVSKLLKAGTYPRVSFQPATRMEGNVALNIELLEGGS